MRLNEILSENQLIIKLKGLDTKFNETYNFIEDTHNFLLLKKAGRHRHNLILENIKALELSIDKFLTTEFYNDSDIDELKTNAKLILDKLNIIKSQIP